MRLSIAINQQQRKSIRSAREGVGLARWQLAKLVGVTTQTIKEIETGRKTPSYQTLGKILVSLNAVNLIK